MPVIPLRKVTSLAVLILISAILAACSGPVSQATKQPLVMAPLHDMPMEVQAAPAVVQASYQFAVANPQSLQDIPCYCGCGQIGHRSNYDCYVADVDSGGVITFDPHALGCQVCVAITQDTMRILREGGSLADARRHVDQTYARYGQSNLP